jgi:hypothetical protein
MTSSNSSVLPQKIHSSHCFLPISLSPSQLLLKIMIHFHDLICHFLLANLLDQTQCLLSSYVGRPLSDSFFQVPKCLSILYVPKSCSYFNNVICTHAIQVFYLLLLLHRVKHMLQLLPSLSCLICCLLHFQHSIRASDVDCIHHFLREVPYDQVSHILKLVS